MTNVIAIDGPSFVGKSTVAQALARLLKYDYINTGHMYRAVARKCLQAKVSYQDCERVVALAQKLDIQFQKNDMGCRTVVDGKDLTDALEGHDIVLLASKIASIEALRNILTEKQRVYAAERVIIMEGRDIGSVVFPDAVWKFFITASMDARARRMYKIMNEAEKKECSDYRTLIPKLEEMDEADMNRKIAPLRMAEDAIVYDNSDSPTEEQDALILQYYVTHMDEIIKNSELLKGKV